MRRPRVWAGCSAIIGLALSSPGTAGDLPARHGFRSELRPVTRQGAVGMDVAAARRHQRAAAASEGAQAEPVPGNVAVHAPLPVPEMPVGALEPVADWLAGEPQMAEDAAPALAKSFMALGDNNVATPPDTHGAVGFNEVMTVLNTQVRVQDRNGNPLQTETLNDFWSSVATASAFDPRVLFDPDPLSGGRWIWAAVQGVRSGASGLLVGVSGGPATPAPLIVPGTGVLLDADSADTVWADYPSVGFNKKWIVVQVNMFRVSDNAFDSTAIYVFDKAAFYAGTATVVNVFTSTEDGGVQVPAATYDFTLDDLYLLQGWNPGAGVLRLYRLSGPVGSELLEVVGSPATAGWADSAPDVVAPAGADDFAPQMSGPPGCTACLTPPCKIQTNDSRIQNVVYRAGKLWATHTVFLPQAAPTRSSVQWWEIDPSAGTRLQGGVVDDPGGQWFYAFPSLAVNRHGDMLVGYSAFEGGRPAGARYSFRNAFDPVGTLRPDEILKDGVSCYFKDFGSGSNRWGDYSATVVDPTDDTRLWTIQEYAEAPDSGNPVPSRRDKWGTWWGMLDTTRSVSIDDVAVTEGNSGTANLTFTVTLSEPSIDTVSVEWSTADDTATVADSDYVAVAPTVLTFSPGETSKPATVLVNGDVTYELDETLFVNLANPTNAVLADAQGKGTVTNDDQPRPRISIGDVVKIEGNGGLGATTFSFPVTLSHASAGPVGAAWATVPGTATPGATLADDYVSGSSVVFFSTGVVFQTIDVQVHGDTNFEADESFKVVLSSPSGGDLQKGEGVGTILDDDALEPGVIGLVVRSDGLSGPTSGENLLQWLNPLGGNPTGIRIKWLESAGPCASYPTGPGTVTAQTDTVGFGTAGAPRSWDHSSVAALNLGTFYCYSVWVQHSGTNYSAVANAMGQPFNALGRVKWKYFTGATAVAPPTVGQYAVVAPSNDYTLHGMERGTSGGTWPVGPPAWSPTSLGSIADQRSPIVPLGGPPSVFVATQDGRVHAVNAQDGTPLWSTQLTPTPPGGGGGGAPAGIFSAWGGPGDYVLVGTRLASNNVVYALNPFTGAVVDRWPEAVDGVYDIGPINGTLSVDYASGLIYFGSWATGISPETLWCLEVGGPTDALKLKWKSSAPANVTTSPVLRGDRVYVGDTAATVWAVSASDGLTAYSYSVDSDVKGFVWPDRATDALYFATNDYVWGLRDNGAALVRRWGTPEPTNVPLSGMSPSIVLFWPGTTHLYVGVDNFSGGNSGVLQIDLSQLDPSAGLSFEPLDPAPLVIGAPSLDVGRNVLHVGSEAGILYAVQVPFP